MGGLVAGGACAAHELSFVCTPPHQRSLSAKPRTLVPYCAATHRCKHDPLRLTPPRPSPACQDEEVEWLDEDEVEFDEEEDLEDLDDYYAGSQEGKEK